MTRRTLNLLAACLAAGFALSGCSGGDAKPAAKDGQLVGLFRLTPGAAQGSAVSGTYFRMLTPGAGPTGPYMQNGNSKADGGRATTLSPGTSGGLRTAGYQSQPSAPFAKRGDSQSAAITKPTAFFGVLFGIATNPVDPQTKTAVAPPTVTLKDGKLTADVSSWGVTWNNQYFNQGAPKPVSSTGAKAPGQAKAEKVWDWVAGKYLDAAPAATVTGNPATGTFDPATKHFVLEWTSLISGGPFNRFTGLWHLEGTFEPSGRAPS
jgi:hypothetical protein